MATAVYKTRVKYVNAFQVGHDNIPNWFIDMVKSMHTTNIVTVNERGVYLGVKLLVETGHYIVEDKENYISFTSYSEEEFKKEYEVQEYLNKDECTDHKYGIICTEI